MTIPSSGAPHDAKLSALLGERADDVLSRPVAYPALRADLVSAALGTGKTCRIKATAARILAHVDGEGVARAVVTELPHGGYRRRYRTFEAPSASELAEQLVSAYSS